jgi:hypothetical protein
VTQQHTFYNNKKSDILAIIPSSFKNKTIYEPTNCTRVVNKSTNYLKLQITAEDARVINFRGKPVIIHLS